MLPPENLYRRYIPLEMLVCGYSRVAARLAGLTAHLAATGHAPIDFGVFFRKFSRVQLGAQVQNLGPRLGPNTDWDRDA